MAISAGSIPCPPFIYDQVAHRRAISEWMFRVSPLILSSTAGATVFITGASLSATVGASVIGFDSTGTSLTATTVQSAIFALSTLVGSVSAGEVIFNPVGNLVATNVQSAIAEEIADLSASSGSSLIGFQISGTGAVVRTVASRLRDTISVTDFGAVGDNATDNTTAFQNAVNAVQVIGGTLLIPAGIYRISGTITAASAGASVVMRGMGRVNTVIRTTSTASDLLVFNSWYSGITEVFIDSSVTRTGGTFVTLAGVETFIRDFRINGDYIGIYMTGVAARIENGVLGTGMSGGYRIRVSGGDTSQIIDSILIGQQLAPFPDSGIRVENSSALMITNTSLITAGNGLHIVPGNGEIVASLYVSNCFFDNSGTGIRIMPSGTGDVVRCRFTNCWASSSAGNGVDINRSGTGAVSGLHFVDLHAILNTASGLAINNASINDITVIGGEFCANTSHGIYVGGSVTDFTIVGATIGSGAGTTGNGGWGVVVTAGCDRYVISDNRFTGNTSGTLTDGGGTNKTITNNVPPTDTITTTFGTDGSEYKVPVITTSSRGLVTSQFSRNIKAFGMDGLQSGTLTTTADGSVHLTFPSAFSAVPTVLATVTNVSTALSAFFVVTTNIITTTSATFFVCQGNDGSILSGFTVSWLAHGPTATVDT